MKKKLSLFLVALFALVAYAASTTWKVTADGATSIEAGTTLTDNDVLLAKTVYASNVVGGCTIGNEVFDNGFQVRVAAFPSGDDKTGTEQSGSTPVVITAKKDCDLTVYYRRQSTAQTENKGAYADNDGKDLIVYKQSDLSKLSGTLTIDHETDDGKYGWATKKVSLTAGETYTLCAKGTTIQFFGFTYETEDPQPAEASYYVVGTMNKWQASDAYKLATNAATEGEYMTTLQLTAGDELKVIKVEGETTTWYPDGMDNNLKVEVSGEYDIYFRPDGQGGQDWYQGYIYLALKDEPAVSYNVHLADNMVNGTYEADKYEVAENEQVLLKVTPNDGFDLDQLTVATATGAPIETQPIVGGEYHYSFVMPGEDVYVSATFKEVEEPQPAEPVVFTFNTDEGIAELGIGKPAASAGTNLKDLDPANTLKKDIVTITNVDGSTATRVWNSSGKLDLRVYTNATLTFKADNKNIKKIELAGASINAFKADAGEIASGVWEGDASEVTLTATANGKINTITVTYGESGGGGADDPVYIAAGDKAVWGSSWDAKDTNNQLTKDNDGKFSITKEDLNLAAGEYGYKIVKDGTWIPDGEGNERKLSIAENGQYKVVLTVDPEAEADYLATATKTGEYVEPEPVYVAVGVKELWGVDAWTIAEENTLIKGNDGKYSITKENLLLPEGQYGYKIVKDGNTWIPDGTDNEKKLEITETAYYNVTLTVDPADVENYLATAEKAASINTIAEVQAAEAKTEVTVQGVIYASAANGAVLYDGDDYLYYYNTKNALNIGQKVLMAGKVGKYGGASQLTAAATITDLGTVDGVVYPDPVELKAADFDAIAKENTETVKRQYVTYTGKLTISDSYYNIAIEGTTANIMASLVAPKEDISELNGKDVVVTGYMMYKTTNKQGQMFAYTVATSIEEYVEIPTYTATFTTNLGWKPVYAYAYNYTPADEAEGVQEHIYVPVEWPGTPMTLNAETGVYEVAIESAEEPNLIIFNDGTKEGSQVGINKTPNWEFENEKAYDYSTQPFAASFTTDKAWEKVYAYVWKANIQAPVEWPGVEITDTKDGDTYYYAFQSTYAPDFIIFNNGKEAEVKEQTSDLVFEDGANYSLTTEKTTAWAGDPEVAISTTTGITIPAKAFEKADVQAEKIIHIVAKEISTAAPAKGFNSDVAELKPTDIAILKNEEPFDKVLIEETAIQVVDDGYQFVADNAVAQEITDHGFIIKPLGDKQIGVEYVEVEQAKAPAAVVNIDFAPAPTDDIGAVIEARAAEITAAGNKVGNITITLGAIGTPYTTTKAIVAPAGVLIQGAGPATSIIDASGLEGDLITLSGSETFAKKADDTDSDHYLIGSVEINNLKIAGLKGTLITDAQKTLLEKLTINNAVVEMPAAAKNVINFNGKGYVGEVVVKNSTIYANGHNTGFFAQYGSRPKNVNGDWLQTFDVQNSTIVGIAYGKNVCDLKQNGTAQNVYTLKNNIFVDFGKSGQVVVGFNKGQTSATPVWNVDNNIFNYDGADKAAAEVEKAGKKGEEDIVKNSIAGVVTFTDAANGDFNGTFALGEGASEPATKPGDPRWTITYATPVVITTMSIVGEFTGGWPVQDPETSAWDWSMAKAMTQDAENANIWTLEMPFVAEAKKYEYKAAANSNWNDYVLPLGDNANFIFGTDEYPAGEYILTFTADTKNHTVGVVAKWNGPEDIKVVPEEGADISTAVQTASEGKKVKDIYVYLAPGKKFTISKSIVAPAAFVFMGAEEGTNPSDIDENATMAEIDASALDGPMVLMSETPAVAADANGFYPLADVGFLNVKVTGLAHQLFYANKQKYLINCFHVDFCNINIAGGSKTIIDTNGGGVIATLDMSKNTIWANPENTGALYSSQSGDKATAAGLAVQTFNIEKNTMYNIAKGKNFCSHRQSNQTWLTYNVKNNTFVNCGKSGQVIKGLNGGSGGANPTWNVDGNAFNFDGADTSANEETGDADEPVKNSLAGVFTFTDATAGDFNGVFKSDAAEAPAKYPGDPRWTYTYESTAPAKFYLIGSMNGWDRTALTEMTFNETTQAYEYEYAPTEKVWFAFADKQLTAEEATADPEWADFNANHRYAIGSGDVNATLNEAIALQKINGTLVLEAGSYKISVAKDLSTVTITGEAPEHTYTVAGSFYYAEGSVAIFGTEWDVANTANDMEKQLDGTYKKVYTIDFPFAGNIQFKVAENHAWDVSYGWDVTAENPDGNAFYNVASPANGATVTITFDPNGATAADKVKIEVTGIPTVGISGIATDDADDNAPIYNLAGQKVDKNYKGVVIKNGKKVYQK